jgi:hypothetical protein
MRRTIRSSLLFFLVVGGIGGATAQSPSNQPRASGMETDKAKIKEAMLGNWESIAPEVRPSKNADGALKPFYLKRTFKYLPSDRFELEIVNFADPCTNASASALRSSRGQNLAKARMTASGGR